jgi:RNA polymerase sigma-70 factor (sigma-E family)
VFTSSSAKPTSRPDVWTDVELVTGRPETGAPYRDLGAGAALTLLHERHYGELVRLATALLDQRASAEEVVQQAYVDVLRRWDTARRADDVVSYLRRAVVNGARDRLRRRRTRRLYVAPHAVPEPGPEDEYLRRDEHRAVLAALQALPGRQREVLVLRHLLGLSEAETAATLGISTSAAKSAAHRGIASLRTELENGATE